MDRRADSAFTRIYCEPVGRVQGVRHVMVLKPLNRTEHPRLRTWPRRRSRKADRAAKVRSKKEKAAAEKAEKAAKDPA